MTGRRATRRCTASCRSASSRSSASSRPARAVSKIADELFLSVKTVSTYRTRVLEKMGMKSNADLTYYAIKNGLIE